MSNIDWSKLVTADAKAAEAFARLRGYAAEQRWRRETGGIEVAGLAVRTDRESQGLITGAALAAQLDAGMTLKWKCADGGFATLGAAEIVTVAQAVAAHVQACFSKEADVLDAIEAGEITTAAAIDAAFALLEGA